MLRVRGGLLADGAAQHLLPADLRRIRVVLAVAPGFRRHVRNDVVGRDRGDSDREALPSGGNTTLRGFGRNCVGGSTRTCRRTVPRRGFRSGAGRKQHVQLHARLPLSRLWRAGSGALHGRGKRVHLQRGFQPDRHPDDGGGGACATTRSSGPYGWTSASSWTGARARDCGRSTSPSGSCKVPASF